MDACGSYAYMSAEERLEEGEVCEDLEVEGGEEEGDKISREKLEALG